MLYPGAKVLPHAMNESLRFFSQHLQDEVRRSRLTLSLKTPPCVPKLGRSYISPFHLNSTWPRLLWCGNVSYWLGRMSLFNLYHSITCLCRARWAFCSNHHPTPLETLCDLFGCVGRFRRLAGPPCSPGWRRGLPLSPLAYAGASGIHLAPHLAGCQNFGPLLGTLKY